LLAAGWLAAMTTCAYGACGGSAFSVAPGDDGGSSSGSGTDGASEGSSGSSSSGSSSGSSGGDGAAGSHWCDTQKGFFFCEDFDVQSDVTAFLGSWTTFEQSGSGAFRFDHTSVPSPPNALGVAGGNGSSFLVIKSFSGFTKPKAIRLEFDLRINSAGNVGPLSAAGFAAIAFGKSIGEGYAAVAIGNGPTIQAAWTAPADAGASDAGVFNVASATAPFPPIGQWAGRYAIAIDYATPVAGTGGCVQVYQGPTPLLAKCLALPPSLGNPTTISVALGDLAAGLQNTGNVDLAFDDLTLSVTP
jgi:hypothetical protein